MASNLKLVLLTAFLVAASFNDKSMASGSNLMTRLKLDEESSNCWGSLIQLQACTSEIIVFFLNGETHLGHGCCQAIRIISEQCWPNLIDTLGFSTEESDILQGYCIKDADNSTPLPPSSHSVPKVVVESLVP